MTNDLETLARRAVACKHWRWMPGMLMAYPKPQGAFGQVVYPSHARVADLPEPIGRGWGVIDPSSIGQGGLPDLSDSATIGCLLALVREAHAAPHAWVEARYPKRARVVSPENFSEGIRMLSGWQIGTEAAALVAALEGAP